jgi:hypothetical protein
MTTYIEVTQPEAGIESVVLTLSPNEARLLRAFANFLANEETYKKVVAQGGDFYYAFLNDTPWIKYEAFLYSDILSPFVKKVDEAGL